MTMTIGEKNRVLCFQRGITQDELGYLSDSAMIRKNESGKVINGLINVRYILSVLEEKYGINVLKEIMHRLARPPTKK